MLEDVGFVGVEIGPPADTFGGAIGEEKARAYEDREIEADGITFAASSGAEQKRTHDRASEAAGDLDQ